MELLRPLPTPITPEAQALLGWPQRRQIDAAEVRRLRQAILLSTRALPFLPFPSYQLDSGQRQGQALFL